jgi:small neutral amino acid transporter SnatA (MarC family)
MLNKRIIVLEHCGSRAMGRLMGMLLILLAMQMPLNGISEFINSLQAG